jgi:hypothetical protein
MKMKLNKPACYHAYNYSKSSVVLKRLSLLSVLLLALTVDVFAQDPVLPATNLGLSNVYDGVAGKPGFAFQGFDQAFQTRAFYNQAGKRSPSDLKINSILIMSQMLYISPVKVLGGNLGFTVLVPIVQINSSGVSGQAPTTNPGVIGDPLAGVAVQWSNRKLFGKPFSNRLEFDVSIPVGNYDSRYNVNPSAHLWNYEAYYAFTIMLNSKISVSSRNQLNYNAQIIGTEDKPGAFYNGSYSVDYSILPAFKVEAVAYFLQQFNQDTHSGDNHYYQDQFGIYNTKERVLGIGPGVAYFTPGGVLFEAKAFFETAAQNRFAGARPTLRIVVPLTK